MIKIILTLLVVGLGTFFSLEFGHGFLNWYLTGFDDLIIFAATYAYASKRHAKFPAILGLLSAVMFMIVVVGLMGTVAAKILDGWAWIGVLVPLFLAWSSYHHRNDTDMPESGKKLWWLSHGIFLRAFLGFLINSSDDIALNISTIFANYPTLGGGIYLSGVFTGAVVMVIIVMSSGGAIAKYVGWKTQVVSYLIATGIIIGNLI